MSLKVRSFSCSKCDYEVEDLLEDEEMEIVIGSKCPDCGEGVLNLMPGRCNLSHGGGRTNIKTSGWFRERSQEMKKKIPGNRIGTGAASI